MMNKKILIILGIIILIIIVISILLINNYNKSKRIELTYKSNGGVPFKWEYVIEDPTIVEFVKSYELKNENKGAIAGAPIYTNYVFKGLKEGTTTITFRYVSITDGHVAKEEINNIAVDKNKNIAIVVYATN